MHAAWASQPSRGPFEVLANPNGRSFTLSLQRHRRISLFILLLRRKEVGIPNQYSSRHGSFNLLTYFGGAMRRRQVEELPNACSGRLGGKQVCRAAIAGWQDVLLPALDSIHLWPFDGSLDGVTQRSGVTVGEIYPAEACCHLSVRIGAGPAGASGVAMTDDRSRQDSWLVRRRNRDQRTCQILD